MALDLQINPGHGGERMESPVDQMERPTPGQRARSFHPVQEAAASGFHYRFLQYSIAEEARRGDDPVPLHEAARWIPAQAGDHAVQSVAPAAQAQRMSITGWFQR